MSFEEAKQYLRTEDGDGKSLYEHLSKVLLKIITEKPADANKMFESISQGLRQESSATTQKPLPLEGDVASEKPEKKAQLAWCEGVTQLYAAAGSEGDATFPDLVTEATVFEWAGINLGKTETYRLHVALKAKALKDAAKLRFWGKILTRGATDYYVVQGENPEPPSDVKVIEGAEGANKDAFWVCGSVVDSDWTRLPDVTPEAIVAARQIKRFFTGDLTAPVPSYPPFPGGTEAHLLRAQIALIHADCGVSPDGFFAEDEDAVAENSETIPDFKCLKKVEEIEEYKTLEDLKSAANWKHHELPINVNGRCNQPPKPEDDDENAADDNAAAEELPDMPVLASLDTDEPGWKIAACPGGAAETPNSVVVAKSLKWPGAVAAAYGNKFLNVYCGFGYQAARGKPYQPPSVPAIQPEWSPSANEDDAEQPTPGGLVEDADVITQPVVEKDEEDEDA